MRNCVIWLVLAEHMQMHLAARARMKNCWTCGTTCFSCVHSQGTHGARDLVQPSAAFWRLRTTCYPLYPSLSLMAEATNWDRGQRLVIHTGTPLGLVMTRLELAVGSIWIHLDPTPPGHLSQPGLRSLVRVEASHEIVATCCDSHEMSWAPYFSCSSLASGCIAFLLQCLKKWQFHNVHAHICSYAHTIPFPPILQVDIHCASSIFTNLGFHFGAFGTMLRVY
jgi:hypothetical protein